MSEYRIAAAVLAGGRSTRMGSPKEKMIIEGDGRTFLDKICDEADACFGECIAARYLSVRHGQDLSREGFKKVEDTFDDIGPLGGLTAVLGAAAADRMDAVLILACDMIRYTEDEIRRICSSYKGEDILWARTEGRDIQPLASIYGTKILDECLSLAGEGVYMLRELDKRCGRTGIYDSTDSRAYENRNCPQFVKDDAL
ncbi:MAG: molybdenum cofactor guanylyltransferase [Lachnospiraceae bacterium]|nr:molybdenum cofactor guanylyltransferase [Lachnospiraceae bacterium]